MSLIFVVDVDGTIADTSERIGEISKRHDTNIWDDAMVDEFTNPQTIKNDELIKGAEILPMLARRCKAKIIFLTGRSERARYATRVWLKNKLDVFDSVPIIMRQDNDFSSTADCKENLLKNIVLKVYPESSLIFFEDEDEVLNRYSKYGLTLRAPDCWNIIRFLNFEDWNE